MTFPRPSRPPEASPRLIAPFVALLTLLLGAPVRGGSVVKIERRAEGYELLRDGKPYFINGAVVISHLDRLPAAGANSARMGTRDPGALDQASRLNLTVLLGLPVGLQRKGFDYGDAARVRRQRDEIRERVLRFKDHPAVLMWGLGNELELQTTPQQRVPMWKEVNRLAEMIRELDPNHPVITTLGDAYKHILPELDEHCPALDAVGLNAYVDMLTLPEDVARNNWKRPYLVTEFGPRGHWQVPKTAWGVPIEDPSGVKAAFYDKAYRHAVQGRPQCLGAYVFLWGTKMEKTHTWYGMLLEDGSPTEAVDAMTRVWTGRWPANRCPHVGEPGVKVRATADGGGNAFRPGAEIRCEVDASDPDEDPLRFQWDLRADVSDNPATGGDWEAPAALIEGAVTEASGKTAVVRLPKQPGKYRIFVAVRDAAGAAATANVPVLVSEK
jgi:hypothetical protein